MKCPHCDMTMNKLHCEMLFEHLVELTYDPFTREFDTKIVEHGMMIGTGDYSIRYFCPFCGRTIVRGLDNAIRLLRGG